jgi:viologen exporter family transport system permease protein
MAEDPITSRTPRCQPVLGARVRGLPKLPSGSETQWATGLAPGNVARLWCLRCLAVRLDAGDPAGAQRRRGDRPRPAGAPIAAWLAEDIGRAGQACLIRFIGPLLVGGLLYGLQVPTRWTTLPLFLLSAALAVVVSFGGRVLVSLIAFWLVDVRGVLTLYVLTSNVLCGLLVPVHFLPGWAQAFAYATPFPSMLQVPLDMATERYGDAESVALLAMQVGWAAVLLAVAVRVFDRGTRKLVLQGG